MRLPSLRKRTNLGIGFQTAALKTEQMHLRLLLVALCLAPAWGLFFDLPESDQKCFTEIVGEDTKVLVIYENPDFVPFGRVGFTGVVSRALGWQPATLHV